MGDFFCLKIKHKKVTENWTRKQDKLTEVDLSGSESKVNLFSNILTHLLL